MAGSRIDQYDIGVTVDGRDLGIWDKFAGGEVDSNETVYKPGGMGSQISLGGSTQIGVITLSVLYDLQRIHAITHWLISRVGKGWVVIKKQPLDDDNNAFGDALTYQGRLKLVHPPEPDSESSNAALLEMEVTPVGTVA
jgi:hypothetical protein